MEKWVSDEFITFSSLIEATVPGRINYFQQNGSEEFAIIFSNIQLKKLCCPIKKYVYKCEGE